MTEAWVLPAPGGCVRLRRLGSHDLADFQAYRQDPQVGLYQGWRAQSDTEALAFLQQMAEAPLLQPGVWCQLGMADAVSDQLIGDIGICLAEDAASAEIGFSLRLARQGQGLAAEGVGALIALLWAHTPAAEVRAITDARNLGSIRLLERLGFAQVDSQAAVFRGEACVEHHYRVAKPAQLAR
ncbi:GNAT family N-acetyltransferase [Paucibacter sp. DJ2R-2]|uniref:GNAT family N-acetyltransferase n=1 Tax=Paucibacter sp. DJ2R-2 TaxID=2893558 RepID=UPI0021E36693|nr:GNAT family N-acetyltransferase [Paucibacter sp. DJ2R-2]MCV2420195.1 GNAT family N-acetyltransferase [Paucibacter sp. DJ4R-1]MCV2436860.1 GNAT family N-acetyltransferase [Paucibacter sp. DJ2R-2]